MTSRTPNEPHRAVLGTAVGTTVLIAVGAFILSFAALTDLAQRSGIDRQLAWIWPIIVDGMIVAATVAIVALNGHSRRAMVYPWTLLFFGAVVSTAANSVHAILSVDNLKTGVPALVSALVAAMPPVVLLAITHLTVHMYQKREEAAQLHRLTTSSENVSQPRPDTDEAPATPQPNPTSQAKTATPAGDQTPGAANRTSEPSPAARPQTPVPATPEPGSAPLYEETVQAQTSEQSKAAPREPVNA